MTEKRFTLSQNGTFHTVKDNVENKPLGVFEFRDDEFPVYACFHRIIDLMNNLSDENEQLKKENQLIKEEKELLKNKLDRIEDILPHFLSCAEISEFRGKTVKEDLALMKCWNKRYQK